MNDRPSIGRRRFLSGALTTAAASLAGPALLAGCGDGAADSDANKGSGAVDLPTYTPYTRIIPELKGNAQGLLDAFLSYPQPAVRAIEAPPGPGGSVSAFVPTSSPVPPALGQNPFWRELNSRLGVDLKLTIVPNADMPAKFATLIAGDDLPDLIVPALYTPNGLPAGTANLPAWLAAKCQDLTPLLGGDAVQGVPLPGQPAHGRLAGLPLQRRHLRAAGAARRRRHADVPARRPVQEVRREPEPGQLRRVPRRLPEDLRPEREPLGAGPVAAGLRPADARRRVALALRRRQARQRVRGGAVQAGARRRHPAGQGRRGPPGQLHQQRAGQEVVQRGQRVADQRPLHRLAAVLRRERGRAELRHRRDAPAEARRRRVRRDLAGAATNNFTAFKKADEGRIRELLKLCNWLATPFGSEEWLLRRYGVAGVHYDMVGGGPRLTQAGVSQTVLGIRYIVDAPDAIFVPGNPAATRKSYEYQASIIPTVGDGPAGRPVLRRLVAQGPGRSAPSQRLTERILSGRKPVSAWDDVVKPVAQRRRRRRPRASSRPPWRAASRRT